MKRHVCYFAAPIHTQRPPSQNTHRLGLEKVEHGLSMEVLSGVTGMEEKQVLGSQWRRNAQIKVATGSQRVFTSS